MANLVNHRGRFARWMAIFVGAVCLLSGVRAAVPQSITRIYGPIEADVQSAYSHIRVRKLQSTCSLMFVRDSGEEVIESMVDLARPQEMLVDYTRYMFLSYAHRPEPKKALIVGLGGGSMVNFLSRYDPKLSVDVVEIDPAIIELAGKFFKIHETDNVKITKADGLKYLAETKSKYDVIYLDAFLKPSADTDPNGVPLALKTAQFYKQIQERLAPDGIVVFNLNPHAGSRDDIATIANSFPQTYVYRLPAGEGFVVVASISAERLTPTSIARAAADADHRFKASYSLEKLVKTLER